MSVRTTPLGKRVYRNDCSEDDSRNLVIRESREMWVGVEGISEIKEVVLTNGKET